MSIKRQNGTPTSPTSTSTSTLLSTSVPTATSRFKVASPVDPNSFSHVPHSFVESLRAEMENPTFDYRDKQNISWVSIYSIPEKIVQTLRKLSMHAHPSKVPGLHTSIRCAIAMGLPQIASNPHVKELKRLELCFNQLPQIGEPREVFVARYLADPLIINFEGVRYNVPVADNMKRIMGGLASSPHIRECDIATWAMHCALLRWGNDVPDNYRDEWEKKVGEIDGLISMKIEGAIGMIRRLPGGEEISREITSIVSEGQSEDLRELSEFSLDSLLGRDINKETGRVH